MDPDTVCIDTINGVDYPRFDLDRSGTTADDNHPGGPTMQELCSDLMWQWIAGSPDEITPGDFTFADVDGDMEPEQIVGINGSPLDGNINGTRISANVVDYQEGDMDNTITDANPLNPAPYSRPPPGLTPADLVMYTYTANPRASGDGVGTYFAN